VSGWSKVKLGQVAEFINGDRGKNYPSEGDFVDQGIPFINAGHLTDGKVVFSNMNYISESRFHLLGSGKTRMNDILYCLRGSLGKTAIIRHKDDAAIASSLVIIRPSNECSVDYLYHFLTSPTAKSELHKFDNGSSQPNLSASSVKNYVLPLPPLAEQRRIAQVLDRAGALRAKRRAALAQLQTLTQAIFLDFFGDPTRNDKDWDRYKLLDVSDNITDGTHDTPPRVASGIPFITSKNIRAFEIDLTDLDFVTLETHKEIIKRCNPRLGDVLYTNIGVNVGNAVANRLPFEFSLKNVALIQPDSTKLNSYFLEALLNHEPFKQSILKSSSIGGAQKFIALKILRSVQVIVPPLSLQHSFARRIAATEQLKAKYQTSLTTLDKLFVVLQHRAFRGEL
jgi:type I restriction enzyme, S subunit